MERRSVERGAMRRHRCGLGRGCCGGAWECGGKLGTESRQISLARLGPETVQRDAVGDQAQLGLVLAQERAAAHGRAADDDGVDPAQYPAEQWLVEAQDAGLADDVGVIREHRDPSATQQPLAHLAYGVGVVQVDHIGPLAQELPRQGQAQRRGGDRRQPAGADHAYALLAGHGGLAAGRVRHQHGDIVPGRGLALRQQLDVVLDAAEDGRIVFVDV